MNMLPSPGGHVQNVMARLSGSLDYSRESIEVRESTGVALRDIQKTVVRCSLDSGPGNLLP